MNNSVCFTGYRQKKFSFSFVEGNLEYEALTMNTESTILRFLQNGYKWFYTGGCDGFDILVLKILMKLKTNYPELVSTIVVPYLKFEKSIDKNLIANSNIIYINAKYVAGCFQARNKYMVDRADTVITYYDGQKGGTKNTLVYAKKMGKQVVNIFEDYEQLQI